jgi:hypothetical protein
MLQKRHMVKMSCSYLTPSHYCSQEGQAGFNRLDTTANAKTLMLLCPHMRV